MKTLKANALEICEAFILKDRTRSPVGGPYAVILELKGYRGPKGLVPAQNKNYPPHYVIFNPRNHLIIDDAASEYDTSHLEGQRKYYRLHNLLPLWETIGLYEGKDNGNRNRS